jgi:hypothetical protein
LRPKNGGFLEEELCLRYLQQIRGKQTQEVGIEDLRKAVDSLQKLGSDFKILTQGASGSKRVICSVSVELNTDHMTLLKEAETNEGQITFKQLQ